NFRQFDSSPVEGGPDQQKELPILSIVRLIEEVSESTDLSPEEIKEQCKTLTAELLDHLRTDLNLELSSDVSTLYEEMQREKLLARVENATRVIECIATKSPIPVGSNDTHYANAVIAEPEGLRIAMAAADVLGPVRFLVGLNLKAIVRFKSDHPEVAEVDDSQIAIRATQMRKSFCRHVVGEILTEAMRYMVLRIPRG